MGLLMINDKITISHIPAEIMTHIFGYLPYPDIANSALVCKLFKNIIYTHDEQIAKRSFGYHITPCPKFAPEKGKWRQLYKVCYRAINGKKVLVEELPALIKDDYSRKNLIISHITFPVCYNHSDSFQLTFKRTKVIHRLISRGFEVAAIHQLVPLIRDFKKLMSNGNKFVNLVDTCVRILTRPFIKFGIVEGVQLCLSVMKKDDETHFLNLAAFWGHLEIVDLFLERNVNVNPENGSPPLVTAVKNGHAHVVSRFLEKGANIDVRCPENKTPLMKAVESGYANVVDVLIKNKADVTLVNSDGDTAYHIAAKHADTNVIKVFYENGFDVDQDMSGVTPLWWACHKGNAKLVGLLIGWGANVNPRHPRSLETALWRATYFGYVEVVKRLIKAKADIDLADCIGQTPLRLAVTRGEEGVVEMLTPSSRL